MLDSYRGFQKGGRGQFLSCSVAVVALIAGCSSPTQIVKDLPSAISTENKRESETAVPAAEKKPALVFRAKYYQTTGPCIQLGDALAMPIIDAFEVVEVLNGELKVKQIYVQAMTEGGPAYPMKMMAGKVYTLRLSPSEQTTKQLEERRNDGREILWIDGHELAEQI